MQRQPAAFYNVHEILLVLPLDIASAVKLEIELQHRLSLPPGTSVFAVRRHDEPGAPPVPLVLAGGLFAKSLDTLLQLDCIVRQKTQHSPSHPISMSTWGDELPIDLAVLLAPANESCASSRVRAAAESSRLLHALEHSGMARLTLTDGARALVRAAMAESRSFFASAKEDKQSLKFDSIDPLAARSGRGVGYVDGRTREFLQLRRALPCRALDLLADGAEHTGMVLPRGAPLAMGRLCCALEAVSTTLLEALALALELPAGSLTDELLDCPLTQSTPAGPPATDRPLPNGALHLGSSAMGPRAGASVLRCYRYRPPFELACASGPAAAVKGALLQGAHADLGLLTVSPISAHPLLEAWDPETLAWRHAERDALAAPGMCDALVFAGETLSFLTAGRVQAIVHKVGLPHAPDARGLSAEARYSMPFFARARPDAVLRPLLPHGFAEVQAGGGGQAAPLTTEQLMRDFLFARRPWRALGPNGLTTDY